MSENECCVLGCPSTPPYFKFPTTRAQVHKWLSVLSPLCDPKMAPASSSVCSRHFLAAEWEYVRGRARLKGRSVPHMWDQYEKNYTDDVPNTNDKDKNEETKSDDALDTTETENQQSNSVNKETEKDDDNEKDNAPKQTPKEDENVEEFEKEPKDCGKNEKEVANEIDSAVERVQENITSVDSKRNKESTPELPSGPRDIDKDKVEDIEELLTYYHIKQNNIHGTTDQEPETSEPEQGTEQVEVLCEPVFEPESNPVFIEISVDKDASTPGETNDCLMVLESVQVDVDPSALMLQEPDREEMEVETLEIEYDPPNDKTDPISLLTSSDEDDVIIEEPHIDTVEVSDETDEDDMPLVKLLKKRRAEKKKNPAKANKTEKNKLTISNITWGLYEYYCVQCHYKTLNATDYRKHMAAHAKVILMCQLCGYMTASSSQFSKHEKQHGEKVYKCDLCDYKAKRNISLVYHMKTHNSKEFKCGECDFVARSDQSILRHIKYCNDSRKFQCDKCEYATKKRSDLKRHISRKHVDDEDEDRDEDYVPPARCED